MTNNKINWLDYLHDAVYCRWLDLDRETIKSDLPILLDTKWRWAQDTGHYNGYTKEDIRRYSGHPSRNGLHDITELTIEEWMNLIK